MRIDMLAKALVVLGTASLLTGGFLYLAHTYGFSWPKKIPGDIYIEKDGFKLYLPLGSCVLVSLLLNVAVRLWKSWFG